MVMLCLFCVLITLVVLVTGFQLQKPQNLVLNQVKTSENSWRYQHIITNRNQRFFQLHSTTNPSSNTGQLPWVYDKTPKSAKEKARFGSQVPFDEEVYETMKHTIELLTKRLSMNKDPSKVDMSKLSIDEQSMLSMKSLTVEESLWFANAIEIIIADAYKYGPPVRPTKESTGSEESTS